MFMIHMNEKLNLLIERRIYMGGFHVKYRKTNTGARYIGISSQLKLPLNLNGDSVVQVYPEFFHGFYQGS